ncbi:hypothetical protein CK203_030169 [Vitis vinifera]|uniref:Uncharacterized protein n=1 Tax=Vitis vinifera TaxID=29760 RepID=A0A438I5E5_VITVI|nr:hypothetical protein CK203_030169 [Vitis vinifera]
MAEEEDLWVKKMREREEEEEELWIFSHVQWQSNDFDPESSEPTFRASEGGPSSHTATTR